MAMHGCIPEEAAPMRHLERSCMPLWVIDVFYSIEALSRKISRRNRACTMAVGFLHSPSGPCNDSSEK